MFLFPLIIVCFSFDIDYSFRAIVQIHFGLQMAGTFQALFSFPSPTSQSGISVFLFLQVPSPLFSKTSPVVEKLTHFLILKLGTNFLTSPTFSPLSICAGVFLDRALVPLRAEAVICSSSFPSQNLTLGLTPRIL